MRKDTHYSILLTTGYRVDCQGKRISQAMKQVAKDHPNIIPVMTSAFITYINGTAAYGFRQTNESRKALKQIQQ